MKISIISTFFNSKKSMKILMDSILIQDYKDIEHIITDAGSNDGSVELLKEYEALYSETGKKLVWKSEPDNGLYDGINKAAEMLTGDLVLFSNDPYYKPDSISLIVNEMLNKNLDYVYGGVIYQRNGKIIRRWSGKPGNWRLGWLAATPTFCIKRDLWERLGPFDTSYKSAADYKLQVLIFKEKHLKSNSLPVPLVVFYAGGVSNNGIKGKLLSIKENLRIMKECKVSFGWFTVLCKIVIAVFAYTFSSRKTIKLEK